MMWVLEQCPAGEGRCYDAGKRQEKGGAVVEA